jgi:hypothetical protein
MPMGGSGTSARATVSRTPTRRSSSAGAEGADVPGDEDGTGLEGKPVLLTPAQWARRRSIQGPATIACQMLQNPLGGQQAFFNAHGPAQVGGAAGDAERVHPRRPGALAEEGLGEHGLRGDRRGRGRNKYLLDGFNHRMDLKRRWETLKELRRKWIQQPGVQGVFVGYEAYGAEADMDYFVEQMEIENNSFPIEELRWPRDTEPSKDDRVQRLGPDFRSHKFYVPAVLSHQGKPCFWELAPGAAGGLELKYTEQHGLTALMARVTKEGSPSRCAKPIVQKDSDGNLYDLTRHFIEQQMLYPFAPLKDLIDAASRIYDMNPLPPVLVDDKDLLPEVYADGT